MTFELAPETRRSKGGARRRITGGKLTGQKPALKMKEVWSIRAALSSDGGFAISLSST